MQISISQSALAPRRLTSKAAAGNTRVDQFQSSVATTAVPSRAELLALVAGGETPTLGDVEGPYYRADAPVRSNLFAEGEPGAAVSYDVTVVDTNGQPIEGAVVDIWTADRDGIYDMESPEFRGRARQSASETGEVGFEGIRPGNYDLGTDPNTGEKVYRPAHVHMKLSAPGFKAITGQLYFPDDKYNEIDPIIDREEGERGFDPSLVMSGENNQFSYRAVLANA